jgi:hypothetical protein
MYAHSLGLGRSAVGDLLDAELVKLGLQLLELLGELLLVLSPELTSLDLGRLDVNSISARFHRKRLSSNIPWWRLCCVCWVVGVEN